MVHTEQNPTASDAAVEPPRKASKPWLGHDEVTVGTEIYWIGHDGVFRPYDGATGQHTTPCVTPTLDAQ